MRTVQINLNQYQTYFAGQKFENGNTKLVIAIPGELISTAIDSYKLAFDTGDTNYLTDAITPTVDEDDTYLEYIVPSQLTQVSAVRMQLIAYDTDNSAKGRSPVVTLSLNDSLSGGSAVPGSVPLISKYTVIYKSIADVTYTVPDGISALEVGDSVTLPAATTINTGTVKRRILGWKTNPASEVIYAPESTFTIVESVEKTIFLYAVWTANYYALNELIGTISGYLDDEVLPGNDEYHTGTYALTYFDGVTELQAAMTIAETRNTAFNQLSQIIVDGFTADLQNAYSARDLKRVTTCVYNDMTYTIDWIIANCLRMFEPVGSIVDITQTTPFSYSAEQTFKQNYLTTLKVHLADQFKTLYERTISGQYRAVDINSNNVFMPCTRAILDVLNNRITDTVEDLVSTDVTCVPSYIGTGVEFIYGTLTSLTLSLSATVPCSERFRVTFKSGATPTVMTITNSFVIEWADGELPEIAANATYQIDVEDGLAVWREFYAAT